LVQLWICHDGHTIRADPKTIPGQQRCSSVSQERCSIEQQSNAGENPALIKTTCSEVFCSKFSGLTPTKQTKIKQANQPNTTV
jgi:hypothetical protein